MQKYSYRYLKIILLQVAPSCARFPLVIALSLGQNGRTSCICDGVFDAIDLPNPSTDFHDNWT